MLIAPRTILLVLLTALLALMAPVAWGDFPNGGFESGSTSGWTVYNPGGYTANWSAISDTDNVHSGSYAGALTAFDGPADALYIAYTSQAISGRPEGTLYRLQSHIKTDGLELVNPKMGMRPIVVVRGSGGVVATYSYGHGSFGGTRPYTAIDYLISLPPNATAIDFQVVLNSGIAAGAVYVDDISIQEVTTAGELSPDVVDAQVTPDVGGTPRLNIDGVVRAPNFFFGNTGNPEVYEEVAKAASADVDLVQVMLNLPWSGASTGTIALTMQANPDAYILPRINFHPQDWWKQANAGLAFENENGEDNLDAWPSLAADAFFDAVKDQLDLLLRFIHNSPYKDRIIGYHLGYLSGGEWFYPAFHANYWDYSEVNRSRFAQWAQSRYADIGTLNASWGTAYADFSEVQLPTVAQWNQGDVGLFRDPAQQRHTPDYMDYHNSLTAERINELAGHVKQLTNGRSLFMAFYGYLNELNNNAGNHALAGSGHLALKQVLDSPDVDFLCSPISYYDREIGDPMNMMSIIDSVMLHGKIYLQEDDSNTYVVDPSGNPDNNNPWFNTPWDTMQCLRRHYGNVMTHNQATWWMDLWADGRFNAQDIWDNNAVVARTYDQSIARARAYSPEIALIYDEETYFWLKGEAAPLAMNNAYRQRSYFQQCGAAVGYYLLEDLALIPDSVKLYVFVNTFRIDDAEADLIAAAKGGGKTFLWQYAPGFVGEDGLSLARMEQITGFPLLRHDGSIDPAITIASTEYPLTYGLEGVTGANQSAVSPTFYGDSGAGGFETLGTYAVTGQPAYLLKEFGNWNSIFCGAPTLPIPALRAVMRYAGINSLVDANDLLADDAITYNGDYLYAYAIGETARRCFQVPWEVIPNGGFEQFTGALPESGFNQWTSPAGAVASCAVTGAVASTGSNACQTGPFTSGTGQYSDPLLLRVQGEPGTTYEVSCDVYVDGLDTASAGSDEYIYLVFQSHAWSADSWTATIAMADGTPLADQTWTRQTGSFTFSGQAAPHARELTVRLKVYGAYSASTIAIDNVSVRPIDSRVVDVFDVIEDVPVATGVTSWCVDMSQNEQKVFGLTLQEPEVDSARALDAWTVEITFSKAMADNAALVDPANYTFSSDGVALTAQTVSRTDDSTVEVTVNEMTDGAACEVIVATGGITDTFGVPLSAGRNTASFTGIGSPPGTPIVITNGGEPFTIGSASVTIEGTCDIGIAIIRVNGVDYEHITSETTWVVHVDLVEGLNELFIVVQDEAGNTSLPAVLSVTYSPDIFPRLTFTPIVYLLPGIAVLVLGGLGLITRKLSGPGSNLLRG